MRKNKLSVCKSIFKFAIGLTALSTGFLSQASETEPTEAALRAKAEFYSKYGSPASLQARVPGEYEAKCIGDKEDPMDFGAKMQTGPYRGECLDLSSNRPVVILSGDEDTEKLTIANLRYHGKFWIATFDRQSVKEVQFETVYFGELEIDKPDMGLEKVKAKTAHTQSRFLFDRPIQLVSQVVNSDEVPETATLSDLTFTFNAYGVNGVGYDVEAGVSGTFGLVGKAIATADRSVEEIIWDRSPIQLYPMDWSFVSSINHKTERENMYHYLYSSFVHSQKMGYKSMLEGSKSAYHTAFRNCTTEAFDNIDEAFPELLAISGQGGKAEPFLWSYFGTKNKLIKNYFITVDTIHGKILKNSGDALSTLKSDLKTGNGTTKILPLNERYIETADNKEQETNLVDDVVSTGWGAVKSLQNSTSSFVRFFSPTHADNFDVAANEKFNKIETEYEEWQQKFADQALVRAPFIVGIYKNVADLAVEPSISNLIDRGFWSEDKVSNLLNDEYKIKGQGNIELGICNETSMCQGNNPRARHAANPTLGVRARVDAEKAAAKAAAEAAARQAEQEKAAAEAAKSATVPAVETKTAADIQAQ